MSEMTYEEKVKKIAAAINAELSKQREAEKDGGKVDDEKIKRMIQEQLTALEVATKERRAGEFDTEQQKRDEQIEEMFKDINAMTAEGRKQFRELKMIQSGNHLKYTVGEGVAEKIEDFKRLNDDAYLISTMLYLAAQKRGEHRSYFDIYRSTQIYKQIHDRLSGDVDLRKALAVATSGSGAEWVPTGFSSQVLTTIELELKVNTLFQSIQMPTNPYKLPVQTSNGEGYYVPESTADSATKIPASTPGTGNAEFSAKKFAGRVLFSEEINEDAIVNMRAFLTSEMGKMIARARETAIINGDAGTASAHMDNQGTALFTSDYDARLAFDGLRYFALNNAGTTTKDFSNADPSDTLMGNVRQLADKYGINPRDVVWIVSMNTYLKMLKTLSNVQTIDKYGAQATVLTGELMKYDGIPVIVSEYLFSNLNASGVYDGTTTDRSMILMVFRPGFMLGYRGTVTLNTDLDIETDQIKLVGKQRVSFLDPYDATLAANPMAVAGINVKTT